jgi:hypothetical protein
VAAVSSPALVFAAGPAAAMLIAVLLRGASGLTPATVLLAGAGVGAAGGLGALLAARTDARRTVGPLAALVAAALLGALPGVLRFRLAAGGFDEPGAGIVAGVMLLAALLGGLTLAADALCPGASRFALVLGRRALLLAAGLGVIAVGLLLKDAATGADVAPLAGAGAACTWAAWLAALAGGAWPASDATVARHDAWLTAAAVLSALALLAGGYAAWQAVGSYAGGRMPGLLAAALAALAARQQTHLSVTRVVVLLAAVAAGLAAAF